MFAIKIAFIYQLNSEIPFSNLPWKMGILRTISLLNLKYKVLPSTKILVGHIPFTMIDILKV